MVKRLAALQHRLALPGSGSVSLREILSPGAIDRRRQPRRTSYSLIRARGVRRALPASQPTADLPTAACAARAARARTPYPPPNHHVRLCETR